MLFDKPISPAHSATYTPEKLFDICTRDGMQPEVEKWRHSAYLSAFVAGNGPLLCVSHFTPPPPPARRKGPGCRQRLGKPSIALRAVSTPSTMIRSTTTYDVHARFCHHRDKPYCIAARRIMLGRYLVLGTDSIGVQGPRL